MNDRSRYPGYEGVADQRREKLMDKVEYIMSHPRVVRAQDALQRLRRTTSRWGEARRFAGRSAGLSLEKIARAEERWRKAWDHAEAEYERACGKTRSPVDKPA